MGKGSKKDFVISASKKIKKNKSNAVIDSSDSIIYKFFFQFHNCRINSRN